MSDACQCERLQRQPELTIACLVHPKCACGCPRHFHKDLIGECIPVGVGPLTCHGCPEYRPAKLRSVTELSDDQVDACDAERLRAAYRELRAHHIEETTVLLARQVPSRRVTRHPMQTLRHDTALGRDEDAYYYMLEMRDIPIDDVCKVCTGYGVRLYSHGSTWRGGVGTNSFQHDICDNCWGSGNRERPWRDLRTLETDFRERVAERAVDLLAHSCGAQFQSESTKAQVRIIIDHIDAIQRKRKIGNATDGELFWVKPLANNLANTLRRALGDEEKEY